MRYIENAQVDSQPVSTIEGQPNTGIFLVKPLIGGESMALLEVRVRAGAASSMHAHSHESLIYVVSGRLKTVIGNETFVLGPGDVCCHPRAVGHRVEALEDTTFIEVKSPAVELRQIFGIGVTSGEAP
jgi:quercetin dioxygenase-like cupin family protein